MKNEKSRRAGEILSAPGKKILLYHSDADGVCSAALVLRFFEGFTPMPREGPVLDDKIVKHLAEMKPAALVSVDLPIDQEAKKLEKLSKLSPGTKFMVIDHHIVHSDLNSENFLHINPRFEKPCYIPASCLVYRLLEELGKDVKPHIWIAATGVIGDYGFKDCAGLIKECKKKCPGSITFKKSIFTSKLGEASEIISGTITLKGLEGAAKALQRILLCKDYKEFMESHELVMWKDQVQAEIRRVVADFTKNAERPGPGLVFYTIKSKLNVTSVISSVVSAKFPDDVIIIRKIVTGGVKISARCQSGRVNVGDLLKKSSAGIGSGGGHEKAAGALVNDWEEFRKRVLANLQPC